MSDLLERLLRDIDSVEDLRGNLIGIAVSGGVDSMSLLHLANRCLAALGGRCVALHVHHGLRDSSDAEEEFVRDQCGKWGIALRVAHAKMRERTPHVQQNLEDEARRLRYDALCDMAKAEGVAEVWVAHHADDQLETMLWRLARGTSLSGLSGMRPLIERQEVRFRRPLLTYSRENVAFYATAHHIPYMVDESNRDTRYTRNYLRAQVVPTLRKLEPHIAEHAAHLSRILQDEDDWMDTEARRMGQQAATSTPRGFRISLPIFLEAPLPLQRRLIKILLYCLGQADWTNRHIESVLFIAKSSSPSARAQLPSDVEIVRRYEQLLLEVSREPAQGNDDMVWDPAVHQRLEGWVDAEAAWCFEVQPITGSIPVQAQSHWMAYVRGSGPWTVRKARPGERIEPLGMNGTKKLSDVFSDAKIPRRIRWQWPVLADGNQVLWIPGLSRSRHQLIDNDIQRGWAMRACRRTLD